MFERTMYFLSQKLVHKKRRDHLHGIGYFFPQKFKMRPCKDDLFERNYQNNQRLERNLRKFSKELNVLSHFVKTLKLGKQNMELFISGNCFVVRSTVFKNIAS